MSHVAPERWADDRLGDAEREAMARHADACEACAAGRQRVLAAREAMREVAAAPPPLLNWELVGARLYWSVSSEMRRRERVRGTRRGFVHRAVPYFVVGATLGAALVTFLLVRPMPPPQKIPLAPPPKPEPAVIELTVNPPIRPAPVAPVVGLVTFLAGEVRLQGVPMGADSEVRSGGTIETGDGRVAVQLGERSAFLVGPHSKLEVRELDERSVVLGVDGVVDVELEKRRDGQRFVVTAGERTVEVRGTSFHVGHEGGALDVSVTRGRVAVIEGTTAVEVPAGSRLSLTAAMSLLGVQPKPFISPQVSASPRALARIPLVPTWADVATLRTQTAMLSVSAPPRVAVKVDGVDMGKGSFWLRTTPGRHLVDGGAGAQWIEVDPGGGAAASVHGRNESERPAQVDAQLRSHRGKFIYCGDRVRKLQPGFSGSVEVEIGIAADGSVSFVLPVAGLDDRDVETCVLDVIRTQLTFPPGTKATVQKVIRF